MARLLAMNPEDQRGFWADQIASERSFPFCTFRDRASDSLLCSLSAWEQCDERAIALFAVRTQVLWEAVAPLAEEMAWDEAEQDAFVAKNETPNEHLVTIDRHYRVLRRADRARASREPVSGGRPRACAGAEEGGGHGWREGGGRASSGEASEGEGSEVAACGGAAVGADAAAACGWGRGGSGDVAVGLEDFAGEGLDPLADEDYAYAYGPYSDKYW
jgi:hypothetical protein